MNALPPLEEIGRFVLALVGVSLLGAAGAWLITLVLPPRGNK